MCRWTRRLAVEGTQLTGLYAGNAKRETARPTAERLLEAFQDITRMVIEGPHQTYRHVTALSPLQQRDSGDFGLLLKRCIRSCWPFFPNRLKNGRTVSECCCLSFQPARHSKALKMPRPSALKQSFNELKRHVQAYPRSRMQHARSENITGSSSPESWWPRHSPRRLGITLDQIRLLMIRQWRSSADHRNTSLRLIQKRIAEKLGSTSEEEWETNSNVPAQMHAFREEFEELFDAADI